ncbi:outer membrane beta-barrel protein, partial [Neisseria sp. P0009.S005]
LYEYTHPINDRFSLTAGAGLGHRVLRDLSRRVDPDDYDRKNRTTYAQINAGVNIALPANFEIAPRIAYNRAVKGRQYSYEPDREETRMNQGGGQG